MKKDKFILLEGCNFIDYPKGGQLTFAKRLIQLYKNQIMLVGTTDNPNIPVGKWSKLIINDLEYDFFAFRKIDNYKTKPKIPARISDLLAIKKYEKEIFEKGIHNVFMQAPELIIATHKWNWESICYRFAGVENPLSNARYSWAIYLAKIFEYKLFSALENVSTILASADDKAIYNLISRSNGKLKKDKIIKFPTMVDTSFFYPLKKEEVCNQLNIINSSQINLVMCGRLNIAKGWEFILDAFNKFKKEKINSHLYYVGDGEDRGKLQEKIKEYNLEKNVTITGFQSLEKVKLYLNLADVVLIGSLIEGWSISMVETLACGKPMVSTKVSGASDIIIENKTGFVVEGRDPIIFSDYIKKALELTNVEEISLLHVKKYSLSSMKEKIDKLWKRGNSYD